MRLLLPLLVAFAANAQPVVVYTALDDMYSRPILDAFTAETGIEVRAVYDTEAAKTTGLVNRIIGEARRPRADVFWNNEVVQTIVLQERGLLEPYVSPSAAAIPAAFKDPEGHWTGFAARARVLIYNTDLVPDPPKSIFAFTDPAWRGKACIAKPLFGTTATHAAVFFAAWGDEKTEAFFEAMRTNEVAVLPGNAQVRDAVARGTYAIGWTDTDDANGAVEDGLPAKYLYPDQGAGEIGTLVLPNTVALIQGAPNAEGGRKLIDYLLSPEVELRLANMRSIQIPLQPMPEGAETKAPTLADIKPTEVDFAQAAGEMARSMTYIRDVYLRP